MLAECVGRTKRVVAELAEVAVVAAVAVAAAVADATVAAVVAAVAAVAARRAGAPERRQRRLLDREVGHHRREPGFEHSLAAGRERLPHAGGALAVHAAYQRAAGRQRQRP